MATTSLSTPETFGWGVAGAFLSYLAVYLLPELRSLLTKTTLQIPPLRVFVYAAILVAMVAGGGLFAVIIGDAIEPKHAAFYGSGWEAALKGIFGTASQLLRMPQSSAV